MRVVVALVIGLLAGCSFIGASVPDRPPAPEHCPEGVIMADVAGSLLFMLPPTFMSVDCLTGGCKNDPGTLPLFIFGLPSAIIGTIYLGSAIYGVHERGKCRRMAEEEADDRGAASSVRAIVRPRAPVVGEGPMYCAITEPDVGACFVDEAACTHEAEHGGGACEARPNTWCFDVSSVVGGKPDTTCAASAVDCDARRLGYAHDASLTVTACGTYTARAPAPAPVAPPMP